MAGDPILKPFLHLDRIQHKFTIKNLYVRYFLAELFGTCLLIFGGSSASAQFLLNRGISSSDGPVWGWGIAVAMAVYVTMGISGGHINPAVSFAFFSVGRLSATGLFMFWIAQYIGAFIGASLVFAFYYEALNIYDGGVRQVTGLNATAQIWITLPQPNLSLYTSVVDQIIGTMVLMIFVMAISDDKNSKIPQGMKPLVIGFLITFINYSFTYNCMGAINPARDFGPRLFTYVAGYGAEVFWIYDYFFWVPLIIPHLGAVLGTYIYQVIIGWHVPDTENNETQNTSFNMSNDSPPTEIKLSDFAIVPTKQCKDCLNSQFNEFKLTPTNNGISDEGGF